MTRMNENQNSFLTLFPQPVAEWMVRSKEVIR